MRSRDLLLLCMGFAAGIVIAEVLIAIIRGWI